MSTKLYNQLFKGSRASRFSCYHYDLWSLYSSMVEGFGTEESLESIIIEQIQYYKKETQPRHEFIWIKFRSTKRPNDWNYTVVDRNPTESDLSTDGLAWLRMQNPGAVAARDEFRISRDRSGDSLLERCGLTPCKSLETITFDISNPPPLFHLAAIAVATSNLCTQYKLIDANCYWFAGIIWEYMIHHYKVTTHLVEDKSRGKLGLFYNHTTDLSKLNDVHGMVQKLLSDIAIAFNDPESGKGGANRLGIYMNSDGLVMKSTQAGVLRTEALLELLSSERAYAMNLALIRDIFLPLAQGKPTNFPLPPSVSSLIFLTEQAPPMSAHDVKIVFGNIEELAAFADELSERLEVALGSVVPGGTGVDQVGELICEMALRMTRMYLTYFTRYPAAVARYTQLSTDPTPEMAQYITTIRALATSITQDGDIPNFIIKPLHRLIKYPLTIQTILKYTPPTSNHPDRGALALAKDETEQVLRQVNDGKRRWEIVKAVLESGKSPSQVKGVIFRSRPPTNVSGQGINEELAALENRVKACAEGASRMAESLTMWTSGLETSTRSLFLWSRSFQRVVDLDILLGGDPQGGSEAVRAFSAVAQSLDDLSRELATVIGEELVPQLHRLGITSREPLLLCAHVHTLAGAHYNLINTPYSKSRSAGLLKASQSYLAISAQLREELPRYIDMFEKAFGIIVLRLSGWQARYFQESERRWREFWIALDVEGNMENTSVETVRIWWTRWETTARQIVSMAILSKNKDQGVDRPERPERDETISPSSEANWDYIPTSAVTNKDHSRAVSSDSSTRSGEFPEIGRWRKGQRRGSSLHRVTDTLFGGTPSSATSASTPFPYSPTPSSISVPAPPTPITPSNHVNHSPRTSHHPVLYAAAAIHPFDPATNATHLGLPFLKLEIGDIIDVLVEVGHPREYKDLSISYEDEPDCMLAVRDGSGAEGWALASYLMPLD